MSGGVSTCMEYVNETPFGRVALKLARGVLPRPTSCSDLFHYLQWRPSGFTELIPTLRLFGSPTSIP